MKSLITALSIMLFLLSNISYADVKIDLRKVIGKTKNSVERYMGTPKSCSKSKCRYRKENTEVYFVKNRAIKVVVWGLEGVSSKSVITALGFRKKSPTTTSRRKMIWKNIKPRVTLTVYKNTRSVKYAIIQYIGKSSRKTTRNSTSRRSNLRCGRKRTCGQMTSCAEARFYLKCGVTRLDRDKDGIPCESICQ